MKLVVYYIIFLALFITLCPGQNTARELGVPAIQSYSPKMYRQHEQNWTICQNRQGIIYAGNSHGLLEYDGSEWRFIHTMAPNIVRSITVDPHNEIYLGGYNYFGHIRTTHDGQNYFISLSDRLDPQARDFGNVWNTLSLNSAVYFQTDSALFCWSSDTIIKIQTSHQMARSFVIRDTLYHVLKDTGLAYFDPVHLVFHPIPRGEIFSSEKIFAMIASGKDDIIIGTRGLGLYRYGNKHIRPWPTEIDNELADAKLTAMTLLSNGDIAIATITKGLFVVDQKGRLIHHLHKQNGIPDNTVWNLYADNQDGLWLALNNGISRVELPARITYFSASKEIEGTVESVTRFGENIFVATPVSLYFFNPHDSQLVVKKIPSFRPYKLISGDDFLVASGYNSGIYYYTRGRMQIISPYSGYSCYQSISNPNRIIIGLNRGITAVYFNGNRWIDEGVIELATGPVRDIVETTDGILWLGTSSDVICKISGIGTQFVSDFIEITYYDDKDGLGTTDQTHVLSMNGRVLFANGSNILTFDDKADRFNPATGISELFKENPRALLDLVQDAQGNAWLFTSTDSRLETGLARLAQDGNYQWDAVPFSRLADIYFYTIYPDPGQPGIVWLGGPDGLFKYDDRIKKTYDTPYQCLVRRVSIAQDSLIWSGTPVAHSARMITELSYEFNSMRFEFSAPYFNQEQDIVYQYLLENFDPDWSAWTTDTKANFTNIPEGNYTFKVQAKNVYGMLSDPAVYQFTILPPWYRTWPAYLSYLGFGALLVFALIRQRSRKLQHEKQELERILAERTKEIQLKNIRLEEQANKLREMDQIKSHFFANISHEFRTPLTLIIGPIQEMIADTFKGNRLNSFKTILRNAKRLLRLINQLLDLAKLESGNMHLQASYSDIAPFLKGILFSFSSYAELKHIHLQYIGKEKNLHLYFDQDKMEQVFYNLISNAFKYTPPGGYITLTVKQPSQIPGFNDGAVEIIVSDSGVGMEKDQLPLIFERFIQNTHSDSAGKGGSGIGLALTKELVELHHGQISIDSTPGEGTECRVILPLGKSHLDPAEIVASAVIETEIADTVDLELAGITETDNNLINDKNITAETENGDTIILIVEDNADVRSYIASHLNNHYQIVEAADGRTGMETALEIVPDLIISDVMMPKMNGFELTKQLKSNTLTSHVPIILLTAKAGDQAKIDGLELGADDYMIKPFNAQELAVRIKNLITTRRELRQKYERKANYHPADVSKESIDDRFMQQVCAIIEQHIDDADFRPEIIQHHVAMSQRQFYRKINALTGQSPGQFIRSMRLKRARQLLENNHGNISQIAYDVGFSNLSYFSKCFREEFGVLPSEVQ